MRTINCTTLIFTLHHTAPPYFSTFLRRRGQPTITTPRSHKGSRFVILDENDYVSKMHSHLDNTLHYAKLDGDPSFDHLDVVQTWSDKWLLEGQIDKDVAGWVTDISPKSGTAFGNVKTHKQGNPVRLITSCCGTAIERLSAFTEFYLKPLSQNLPSNIKDTTDLINKVETLNSHGPLPPGTLLVSWDVVNMFPNIDNALGLSAVEDALNSRPLRYPSTACILEAVNICLQSNNCQFGNSDYLQHHGTAMGPRNACSYADLAMGVIDRKAKYEGDIKPNLWWRYRDDIIDVWSQGVDKLLQFTEYINGLYPTIKFELVYSEQSLNVLDLTLHLREGHIFTDIYAKPTDSHLYLPFSSSHPHHCKRAIPYGVALRLRRNCSTDEHFKTRCEEYKSYLIQQGYGPELVHNQFQRAVQTNRADLLQPKSKSKRKTFPLVTDFNPRLPNVSAIINKHLHLLQGSNDLQEIFPRKSIIPAYRRTKNLKDILAPSRFKNDSNPPPPPNIAHGCVKCNKRCDLCQHYFSQSEQFQSLATGRSYNIRQRLSCTSFNVVYLASCCKCRLQYVGSTSNQFKVRFRNHKSDMLHNKRSCEVAIHFNNTPHTLSDFNFIVIEKLMNTHGDLDANLLKREAYWAAQLHTLQPHGLNKRCEFRSQHRINYQS